MNIFNTFDNTPKPIYYNSSEKLDGLNSLKFLCSLLVAAIHIPFILTPWIGFLYRIAVPIFFMISGYFLVGKDGTISSKHIFRVLKKIIGITIIANLIYFIYKYLSVGKTYFSLFWAIAVGDNVSAHLWYLNSYIQALIILWMMIKCNMTKILPLLIPIGLVLNILLGSYNLFIFPSSTNFPLNYENDPLFLHRNFLTIGLPCIVIGMLIRFKQNPIPVKSLLLATILTLSGLIIEIVSYNLSYPNDVKVGDINILTIPFAICLFLFCLNIKSCSKGIGKWTSKMGETHSMNIYLWHLLVASFISILISEIAIFNDYKDYWLLPGVCILSILLSVLIIRIKSLKFVATRRVL